LNCHQVFGVLLPEKDNVVIDLPIVTPEEKPKRVKKPDWLRVKLPIGEDYKRVRKLVDEYKLNTICQSGNCPNMGECWGAGTATFMILGNVCTRSCSFCAVKTGRPPEYDVDEPRRVAEAIMLMQVKHAVITSVNRDELKDRGASIWHDTVKLTKEMSPTTTIETSAGQEVVSHNMETVERLYRLVRPQAKYHRSLEEIKRIKEYGKRTKTGFMLGLGETKDEVLHILDDLAEHGCDVVTIGQYLQPTKMHLAVADFVHPDMFAYYKEEGLKRGFSFVESGPLVRSSYHAERHL